MISHSVVAGSLGKAPAAVGGTFAPVVAAPCLRRHSTTKGEGKRRSRPVIQMNVMAAERAAPTSIFSTPSTSAPSGPTPTAPMNEHHPSLGWQTQPHHLSKDELWQRCREEAQREAELEPRLASFLYSTILAHPSMEKCLAFLLANKLGSTSAGNMIGPLQLMRLFQEAYEDDPGIMNAAVCDMLSVKDRDPACERFTQCLLYFKGWQAVQCHRVAHWLWSKNRRMLASALHSRVAEVFHTDIHPAAQLGRGILLDHATGVVIGETAIVGDNVSMLHRVSLGGSGLRGGARHPKIGHGVLLGAGVIVLGPVTVGAGSKVGAGSVVVTSLPQHCVAVGVPARIVRRDLNKEPVQDMDQVSGFTLDYII